MILKINKIKELRIWLFPEQKPQKTLDQKQNRKIDTKNLVLLTSVYDST